MNPANHLSLPNTPSLTRRGVMEAMREQAFSFGRYKILAHAARIHGDGAIAELFEQTADEECLERFASLGELLELADEEEPALQSGAAFFEADAVHALFSRQAQKNADGPPTAHGLVQQPEDDGSQTFQDALARLRIMNWLAATEQTRHS